MNHHHMPSWSALFETAVFIISPSDITCDGPRPRKSRVAAVRIEPPKSRMKVRKRYELMFGAISLTIIRQVPAPDRRARLTKSREASENVWARIARAAHGHEVRPIRIASDTRLDAQVRRDDDQHGERRDHEHDVREHAQDVVDHAAAVAAENPIAIPITAATQPASAPTMKLERSP